MSSIKMPKIGRFDTKIKTPKISIPRLNFVSKPIIATAKGTSKATGVKVKYK